MTGAEHFAEAERLLQGATDYLDRQAARASEAKTAGRQRHEHLAVMQAGAEHLVARAQVHATLAVAASQLRSLPATQDTTD